MSTVPEEVTEVRKTLTADNAVNITCRKQKEYGPRADFILVWGSDGEPECNDKCEFRKENLYYLTNYTFKVS